MSYSPPAVSSAGLSVPTYTDILNYLIEQAQQIYGPGEYLGNDSALYQLLSVIALMEADAMQAAILSYNNRSPVSAIGAGLDGLLKLNGLARKSASYSTCAVALTGTPGAVIQNGIVGDVNGSKWDLPAELTIPGGGTLNVTAICEKVGAINANVGELSIIQTPTAGWISVTNAAAATPGQPVETDSQARARQAISTELPSISMLAGTIAAIAATPGVSRYSILENPTGSADSNGNPAHSITCVVEGGLDADIAMAIYQNRSIGCYTNGTTTVNVTDPNNANIIMPMRFSRPVVVPIYVTLGAHPGAGYTSATTDAIKAAIAAYLNSLQIGQQVAISALNYVAMSVAGNIASPSFAIESLTAGTAPAPVGTSDIAIAFDHVSSGSIANVTINLV